MSGSTAGSGRVAGSSATAPASASVNASGPVSASVRASGPGRRTVRIGITGPIGCGKSTVARWLAARGAAVVDADQFARDVVKPGEPTLEAVIARFGDAFRAPDGGLDRAALGRAVFSSPVELADLEAIIHPAVRPRILAAIAAAEGSASPAVVIEAIKLVEGGLAALCDEVWLVTCSPNAQRDRLAARGVATADAEQRIAAQGDLAHRLASAATRIIDTSGHRADAEARVDRAWRAALGG